MSNLKSIISSIGVIVVCLLNPLSVNGEVQPTAEQLRLFSQLSPEEQQRALQAIRGSSGGSNPVKARSDFNEPVVVTPREVETDKKLEQLHEEGSDAPEINDKSEKSSKAIEPPLKQFGYDLFAGTPTTFAPATDIPIPTEYVVGPGDNVQIQLFGKENADYDLVVSREGKLRFPGIGPISVAGLRFDELKSSLQKRIKRQMIGVNANITMGTLRSIRIFVLGDVIRPGSYTVSALSNMTNALFVSGGIKPIGSLRKIQLKRAGKIVTTLDLYDLLMRGDTSNDRRLQPGDVIFVPSIGSTIGVAGEVRRPAIYEMKDKQDIAQALEFAGGLLPTAYPKLSQLERITKSGEKTLVDVDVTDAQAVTQFLNDGDVLRIYSVLDKMQNIVLVKGHVHRPGGTQWFKGMRLTDVISSVDDLLPKPDLAYVVIRREVPPERYVEVVSTRLDKALEDRSSVENVLLQPRDELYFFGLGETRSELIKPLVKQLEQQERYGQPAKIITVNGSVHYPGKYPYSNKMSISDAVRAAYDIKPLTDLHYALVARQINNEGKLSVLATNLQQALQNPHSEADLELRESDSVYIFSAIEEKKEDIGGDQVKSENKNETDKLADKEKSKAKNKKETDKQNADKEDKTALNRQALLKPLIQQLSDQTRFGELAPIVSIGGLVKAPGDYPLTPNMQLKDLIRAAGYLTESAYTIDAELSRYSIVNNEYREIKHYTISQSQLLSNNVKDVFLLQPYDHLQIKRLPQWTSRQSIELRGEFRFPGNYTFHRGETLSEVIKRAGGLTNYSFPEGAVFMRKDLRDREQKNIDRLASRLESDLAALSLENAQGSNKSDSNSLAIANSLLEQLKSTKASGRLVINLNQLVQASEEIDPESSNYIVLKDGDELVVPPKTQEVTILGEVQQSTSHIYNESLDRDDYINLSGGLTHKADEDRIYIVRANGAVISDESAGWFGSSQIVYPGDTIVVPLDADRMKPLTLWTNVTKILYQLGVSAAAWKTVGLF